MASEHEARSAVERATVLSDDMIHALEDGGRAAIDAVGRFVITLEEALPQEVKGTSEVEKKITESALEMAQQLVHTQADFLRKAVDSAGSRRARSSAAGTPPARAARASAQSG